MDDRVENPVNVYVLVFLLSQIKFDQLNSVAYASLAHHSFYSNIIGYQPDCTLYPGVKWVRTIYCGVTG